ncbi:MAG: hypothetical protein WBP45_13925 [Daejeonella sp.]
MKLKILIISAFALFLFFFSCRKDFKSQLQQDQLDPFLALAKENYYSALGKSSLLQSDSAAVKGRVLRPKWTRGYVSKISGYELAEIPVLNNKKEIAVYNFSNKPLSKEDQLNILNASFQRLLIFRNKAGIFNQCLLSYIPDLEYLKNHQYDASGNYLSKLQKDFSGYIEYSELNGKRLFVVRIEKGKRTKAYRLGATTGTKVESQSGSGTKTMGFECFEVCTPVYVTYCTYSGDPEIEFCGDPQYVGDNCYPFCVFIPDDPLPPGGGEPGEGPGDEGGGGPGEQPEPEEPAEPDPCQQAKALGKNEGFKDKMNDLKSKTGLPNEVGYEMRKDANGNMTYNPITGLPGKGQIDFNPATPIDGYIHTHYTGLLPIFTLDDVKAAYLLANSGKVTNWETFTAGVVTDQGTTYLFKIEDNVAFGVFGNAHLGDQTKLDALWGIYNGLYYTYHDLMGKSPNEANELAFLKTLEDAGIKTFKGDITNFNSWNAIKEQSMTTVNDPCN